MAEEKSGEDIGLKADFLFEVSWEICNKVGGIYTVIKTKVSPTSKIYGENYCLIGPYFHDKVKGEFEETIIPDQYKQVCDDLKEVGIVLHYGKWLTDGNPNAILIDFHPLFARKDEIKTHLWEHYKVDSLNASFEFEEPVVWAWAVGMVIERLSSMMPGKKVAAMFHEWISGSALLYLKSQGCKVGTVFITHATVLGRSLASSAVDLYCHDKEGKCLLDTMEFDKEAYNKNAHTKHQLEKASAHAADVFATVSEITGMEAEHILQKKPDIIVPNGLDISGFPTIEENSIRHKNFRDKIYHFLLYYFFPYYHLDIEKTLIYFIASRYEVHDKGIDIFTKALGKLNDMLKKESSKRNIVAFFWVPSGVRGIKPEIIENRMLFKDIEDSLKDNSEHVMWRLLSATVADSPITKETIFTKNFLSEIKRKTLRFKREESTPPLCTHDLIDYTDPIMQMMQEQGLNNSEDDKVKVIMYPIYLTGADGLLDLNYYEAMQGSHFGVFPSFYEPWGYTPLEAGALGVASVTTDLAGFGRFALQQKGDDPKGVFVIKRMGKQEDEATDELAKLLYYFTKLQKKKRVENKIEARRLANLADWDILINNYINAQNMAIDKVFSQ
ncbi:hypothetical protein KY349_04315 [Candidatus Woesearchaeota archaeon]|nr:hypothetical protein [Candidatus Woesearchaeota archaeon]